MPYYPLINGFAAAIDSVVTGNPFWVLAHVGYQYPLTFCRHQLQEIVNNKTGSNTSFNVSPDVVAATRSVRLIDSDCVGVGVSTGKDNHVSTAKVILADSGTNYLAEIMPGDWLMAWMMQSEADYNRIRGLIRDGVPANDIRSGLKFVGRVRDIRKTLALSATGLKTVQYNLGCTGFGELDSSVFFDPALKAQDAGLGVMLARMGQNLYKLLNNNEKNASFTTGKVVPALIDILVGKGVPSQNYSVGKDQSWVAGGVPYLVPAPVGQLLGITRPSDGSGYSYADLLTTIIGLQQYDKGTVQDLARFHTPSNLQALAESDTGANRFQTQTPVKGEFVPLGFEASGKTLWTMVNEFLNDAVNEAFTGIRITPLGRLMPTLVMRQKPFTTDPGAEALGQYGVTRYDSLPCWDADPVLVKFFDTGRSDGGHFNFMHVYGQASAQASGIGMTQQLVINPPIRDEADMRRHGLRPYMSTVACSTSDTLAAPRQWMALLADFHFGMQFALTGTVTLAGIQDPICPGDNFRFDSIIYHIESVDHQCSIDMGSGRKTFETRLNLSYGIRDDADKVKNQYRDITEATVARPPNLLVENSGAAEQEAANKRLFRERHQQLKTDAKTVEKEYKARFGKVKSEVVAEDTKTYTLSQELHGVNGQNPDLLIYGGIDNSDQTGFDPGTTADTYARASVISSPSAGAGEVPLEEGLS